MENNDDYRAYYSLIQGFQLIFCRIQANITTRELEACEYRFYLNSLEFDLSSLKNA
jgi:hypothetical protein